MIKRFVVLFLMVFLSGGLYLRSQEKTSSVELNNIPERISVSLDALLKTRTSNEIYSVKYLDSYFYVLQKSVYVNVLFTAELSSKFETLHANLKERFESEKSKYDSYVAEKERTIKEENIKIEEENSKIKDPEKKIALKTFKRPAAPVFREKDHYFNFYLRIVKEGKVLQKFKAPVPYRGEKDSGYFSFGVILEPGKYDILMDVDAYDNSEDGTQLFELEVPKLTLADITTPLGTLTFSKPRFYKSVYTLLTPEKRFTVTRNGYQIGVMRQEFHPYIEKDMKFAPGETPILTFFIKGARMANSWNILTKISILKVGKSISVFKPFILKNPYFYQPVKFVTKDGKNLKSGTYSMKIEMSDNNSKGNVGKINIPFSIAK